MELEYFISPLSSKKLNQEGDSLICENEEYIIKGEIPRFVDSNNYSQAFGLQWKKFQRTQLDSFANTNITEKRLEEAIGHPLSQINGKRILEAGSGAGRFTEILLKYGAIVHSFDYSVAVEANYENNMPNETLTLFQADIGNIPLPCDMFDYVIVLGVLQHTPSTKKSLEELQRVLKPNGLLVCDHYKYFLGVFTSLYLVWWVIIKNFSPNIQIKITDNLTKFFFPIHWYFRKSYIAQKILNRLSPINFYYGQYDLPKEILFEWSRLDTHDRNTDHFKRHVTKKGFEKIFNELSFDNIEIKEVTQGYLARASKVKRLCELRVA